MRIATFRLVLAAAAVAFFTVGAQAQSPGAGVEGVTDGDFGGAHHRRGNTQKAAAPKPKVDEKGYKAALDQLPNKQYDAWHGVR